MNKTLIIGIALALMLGTIILLVGIISINQINEDKTETRFNMNEDNMVKMSFPEKETKSNFNNEFKDEFVKGCNSEGGSYTECACMYDSMIDQVGFDGMIDMSINYLETEELPMDVMTEAVETCY